MNNLLPISYQSELTRTLEEILREFETLPISVVKNFWNPSRCREDLLPYLAVCLGVSQWDSSWVEAKKRKVCLSALQVNKKRGTLGALRKALEDLNLSVTITEWWQQGQALDPIIGREETPMGKGTAEINLHERDVIYSEEQYRVIYRLVDEVKRLSLLIAFKKTEAINGDIRVLSGAVVSRRIFMSLKLPIKHNFKGSNSLYQGGVVATRKRVFI